MQRGEQARLALKSHAQLRVGHQGLLERDRITQACINRLIDRTHAALGDQANDAIAILEQAVRLKVHQRIEN